MIILEKFRDRVSSCQSDDGLVTAVGCPDSTLSGEFYLVEVATGRYIDRGEYQDYDRPISAGSSTGEKVPADVWQSACKLMNEWQAQQRALEAERRARADQRDFERYNSFSERIAQAMDRADSDL